jgi:hypothetical protein
MKALVAALNRIAAALEQLVPAVTQATRETRQARISITGNVKQMQEEFDKAYRATQKAFGDVPPDPRYPEAGNG